MPVRKDHQDVKPPGPPEGFERHVNPVPLIILGVVVLGVFVTIGVKMFTRSVTYYRTPTEVSAQASQHVRLSGTVVPGSIRTDTLSGTVTFQVADDTTTLTVVYVGPKPDTLQDDGQAVAEGALNTDGTFHADTLFAKCPSKFQAKT